MARRPMQKATVFPPLYSTKALDSPAVTSRVWRRLHSQVSDMPWAPGLSKTNLLLPFITTRLQCQLKWHYPTIPSQCTFKNDSSESSFTSSTLENNMTQNVGLNRAYDLLKQRFMQGLCNASIPLRMRFGKAKGEFTQMRHNTGVKWSDHRIWISNRRII